MKTLLALTLALAAAAPLRAQDFDGNAVTAASDYLSLRAEQNPLPEAPAAEPALGRAPASDRGYVGPIVLAMTGEEAEAILAAARRGGEKDSGGMAIGVEETLDGNITPERIARMVESLGTSGATVLIISRSLKKGIVADKIDELTSRGVKVVLASPR